MALPVAVRVPLTSVVLAVCVYLVLLVKRPELDIVTAPEFVKVPLLLRVPELLSMPELVN